MDARPIGKDELLDAVAAKKGRGFRFVTISCVELDAERCDLLYHFDKDLELQTLRLTAARDEPVPSVSGVYFAAFLVENEIQDQFGLQFENLALDFGRTLLLDEEVTTLPFCKYSAKQKT